jgi:hypothetical protein
MLLHMRNLLVLGALGVAGPLSAGQHNAAVTEPQLWTECPYESARVSVMIAQPAAETSRAALPVFDVGRRAPGLLP